MIATTNDIEPLTTGQAARICRVAPRTIALWVDTGKLPAYKLPNRYGSGERRRIEAEDLARFLAKHRMVKALEALTRALPGLVLPEPLPTPDSRLVAALAEIRDARPGDARQCDGSETPEQFARRLQAIAACALDLDTEG